MSSAAISALPRASTGRSPGQPFIHVSWRFAKRRGRVTGAVTFVEGKAKELPFDAASPDVVRVRLEPR